MTERLPAAERVAILRNRMDALMRGNGDYDDVQRRREIRNVEWALAEAQAELARETRG